MAKFKKEVYTMIEIAERVMEKWPGRYKSIASANAAVRGAARELGIGDINGKGKYKNIAAKGAERILEHLGKNYRKTSTPLEKIAKKDEATEFLKGLVEPKAQVDAIPSERNAEIEKAEPVEVAPLTATEKKAKNDEFETRRKKFYTDVNYFLKYAQSSNERVAIWGALSKLYGLGAQPFMTYEEPKNSTLDAKSILDI